MKHLLLCLFALLVTIVLRAQTDISDYSLRHFTSENGLSQNTVKAIAVDDYGFIWLATESGLLRFDGNSFRQFDKTNMDVLSSRATDIQRHPDNNELLAVFDNEELIRLSGGKAEKYRYSFHETFLPRTLKKLVYRPIKWLHQLPGSDSLFFRVHKQYSAIVSFHHGIAWYTDKGFFRHTDLPGITQSDEVFPFGDAVYCAAPKHANTLLRITPEGIRTVAFTGDFLKLPARSTLKNCIIESYPATGQAFLYAGQHLYQLIQEADGSVSTHLLLSGFDLDEQLIYCTYYDSLHGRIFMGSLTNGLYILDHKKFHTAIYDHRTTSPVINVVYDHVPVSDSSVLAGSGILFYTNPGIVPVRKSLGGLYDENSHSTSPVFRSRNGSLWICAASDVRLMDNSGSRIINKWPVELPRTIAESKDGRIWIGTDAKGLYVLDPHDLHTAPLQVLPESNRTMCLEWEDTQTLWMGTVQHLLRFNIHTGTTDTIRGLTGKMTRNLYVPHAGEVWICTYEDGLFLWQNGKLTHFPITSYPHLKTVHKILEDRNGFFWISTNHGIYQARHEDLLRYARSGNKEEEEPYLFYYSKESGFLTNEFNGGSQQVGSRLNNGFFSFSSMNGIVFFRPSEIKPELPEAKFIIDKLEVDDKEITIGTGPVTLNRKFRTLKITPVSAYMGNPANLKYEFRLNNDSDWRNTYNGAVILSSLPVGYNDIFIRKKAGFGSGNYVTNKLTVYIPPAWWQTKWFYISAGILLIVLVWLIVRLRVRYWKKRNKQLETVVRNRTQDLRDIIHDLERSENKLGEQLQFQRMLNENITHDITTPLKYLTIFAENVLDKTTVKDDTRTDIEHIHQGANRIYEVVQNLGQYMRARLSKNISATSVDLHQLAEQKAALFRIAAAARGNTIGNDIPAGLFVHQNESLISIVLHNLIDNAVKNTEKGTVTIGATVEQNLVLLHVADTGKGITPAQVAVFNEYFKKHNDGARPVVGFGFLIIKEIMQLLKLDISIATAIEKGTVITLHIPLHNA